MKQPRSHGRQSVRPSLTPRALMEDAPDYADVWQARVITLFPELFPGVLGASLTAIVLGQFFLLGGGVTDFLVGLAGLMTAAATLVRGRRRLPERFTDLSLHMLDNSTPLDCGSPDRNP